MTSANAAIIRPDGARAPTSGSANYTRVLPDRADAYPSPPSPPDRDKQVPPCRPSWASPSPTAAVIFPVARRIMRSDGSGGLRRFIIVRGFRKHEYTRTGTPRP